MEKTVKIADAPGYVRSTTQGGAVLLNNTEVLDKYNAEKKKRLDEVKKIVSLQGDVAYLLQTVSELRATIEELRETCKK